MAWVDESFFYRIQFSNGGMLCDYLLKEKKSGNYNLLLPISVARSYFTPVIRSAEIYESAVLGLGGAFYGVLLHEGENLYYKIISWRECFLYEHSLNMYLLDVYSNVRVPITEVETFYKAGTLAPGCLDRKLKLWGERRLKKNNIILTYPSESSEYDKVLLTDIRAYFSDEGTPCFYFDRMKSPAMTVPKGMTWDELDSPLMTVDEWDSNDAWESL